MSTKIYNGYKLPVTMATLAPWCAELSARMTQNATTMLEQTIGRLCVHDVDDAVIVAHGLSKKVLPETSIYDAVRAHVEECREKARKGEHAFGMDTESSLVVFTHSTGVYGLFYGADRDMERTFRATPGVEFWGYWNNTDPEDGVGEEDWAARGQMWNDLLGPSGIPAESGTTIILTPHDLPLPSRPQADLDPSDPERALRATLETTLCVEMLRQAGGDPFSLSAWMDKHNQCRRGQIPEVNAMKERVASVLPTIIPAAWLDMTPQQLSEHLAPPSPRTPSWS